MNIYRFNKDPPYYNKFAWRVLDNGQGNNADPDSISLQFVGAASGFAANYCTTTLSTPALNNVQAGNIQVKP